MSSALYIFLRRNGGSKEAPYDYAAASSVFSMKYSVADGWFIHKDMGHGADQLSILQYSRTGHRDCYYG